MKTYKVVRTPDGDVMAFVDGNLLHHIVAHTPAGFAFGRGAGADDLALSILADHFGERPSLAELYQDEPRCLLYHQDFKWAFITPASEKAEIELTTEEIRRWLSEQ